MFFSPHTKPVLIPQNDEDCTCELTFTVLYFLKNDSAVTNMKYVQPCATHTPSVTNGTFEGNEVYMTSDLFIKHPTIPNLYRVHGRSDDQIMLSTGEKVMWSIS